MNPIYHRALAAIAALAAGCATAQPSRYCPDLKDLYNINAKAQDALAQVEQGDELYKKAIAERKLLAERAKIALRGSTLTIDGQPVDRGQLVQIVEALSNQGGATVSAMMREGCRREIKEVTAKNAPERWYHSLPFISR